MNKMLDIFKCDVCDTVVEILDQSGTELICCGRQMQQIPEQVTGHGGDMHCPIVEAIDEGIRVSVGPLPHVMRQQHYIEWIEVIAGGKCFRQFLKPGAAAEAVFAIQTSNITVRAYCTVHGLWKAVAPIYLSAREIHAEAV